MKNVLPRNATWIKEKVVAIEPEKCLVTTDQGRQVGQFYYSIFQPNRDVFLNLNLNLNRKSDFIFRYLEIAFQFQIWFTKILNIVL